MTHYNLRDFTYSVSSDITLNAAVKIEHVQGVLPELPLLDLLHSPYLEFKTLNESFELYILVTLHQGLHELPVLLPSKTNFSTFKKEKDGLCTWRYMFFLVSLLSCFSSYLFIYLFILIER
ncbi:hypothetical protein HMI54_004800 [Coelomomyces lativittatus]|nr:hypothetical protein HMI56_002277 [Coelomomyces lativittatus]KAJ1517661.1 hypothetical protein HMI54_004800 [Coelomomyces lativittatus]